VEQLSVGAALLIAGFACLGWTAYAQARRPAPRPAPPERVPVAPKAPRAKRRPRPIVDLGSGSTAAERESLMRAIEAADRRG
jgi:hypothetical protein